MKEYQKKPVVVSAGRWWKAGDVPDAQIRGLDELDGKNICRVCENSVALHGHCKTLEGWLVVCPGDYIIRGVKGEYYPCKPDIFERTYKLLE